MCGIVGKLYLNGHDRMSREEIERMLTPILHRGPDGNGMHIDGNLGLGHCRLSIIDVGGGAQPMTNEDGSVWIVFNGEIYNFQELRDDLIARGHILRSNCDTEVIVHLYEEFGVECVTYLRGMFAFAIWDAKRSKLFLARDRVGIKPLYLCQTQDALYFASELKAILSDPGIQTPVDLKAMRSFFSFSFQPLQQTMFEGILKLLPGSYMEVLDGKMAIKQYWDLGFPSIRKERSFDAAVRELYLLLEETVRDHMISDVPVGVLLSGGIDSSAVLSFAVKGTPKKVSAFTIGFENEDVVDERPYARLAAKRFGADHHEMTITAEDFWAFLPEYVAHMEELVCEPPAVALYYISKLARNHVKVLLSGEGGDEAFAGYPNYPNMLRLDAICRTLGPLARPAGSVAEVAGALLGNERILRYGTALGRPLAQHYFSRRSSPASFFNRFSNRFFSPRFLKVLDSEAPAKTMQEVLAPAESFGLLDQMLYADTKTWLPDDLLIKADKITMANSLELRVPLLDHKVLEFAASLPSEYKVKGKDTKRVLKAAFSMALPREILDRKKVGFPVPYSSWMRGPLKDRLRNMLLSEQTKERDYFIPQEVEKLVARHEATGENAKEVFSLLITEIWHRHFVDTKVPKATRAIGLSHAYNGQQS
jgi:asparagine synthase (glutamine-hydrolysing)